MTQEHNPILNNPYEEPGRHYATRADGSLDYEEIKEGRRIFIPTQEGAPIPKKAGKQKEAFEANDFAERYETELVNLIRKEVKLWREDRVKPRNALRIRFLNGALYEYSGVPSYIYEGFTFSSIKGQLFRSKC